jgi:two-component system phosphate regulon sensor histidine kinase PhoR
MADELQTTIENLKNVDQVRTDFVANVSHELKTPLASIKGFIETLEDGAIDDKENAQRFIRIIKKHANALNTIIDDLLSLSELELGKSRLHWSGCNLQELVEETTLGFGHALSIKEHKIKTQYNGKDFNIFADRSRIEQVLVNLLDNAIKYTDPGGRVKIILTEHNYTCSVTVEDNGMGIPQDHANRVFERFYRVDKARSRDLGGTGLGLSIVKHIVSLHNGTIRLDSTVNKGTRITVTLPRAK